MGVLMSGSASRVGQGQQNGLVLVMQYSVLSVVSCVKKTSLTATLIVY